MLYSIYNYSSAYRPFLSSSSKLSFLLVTFYSLSLPNKLIYTRLLLIGLLVLGLLVIGLLIIGVLVIGLSLVSVSILITSAYKFFNISKRTYTSSAYISY